LEPGLRSVTLGGAEPGLTVWLLTAPASRPVRGCDQLSCAARACGLAVASSEHSNYHHESCCRTRTVGGRRFNPPSATGKMSYGNSARTIQPSNNGEGGASFHGLREHGVLTARGSARVPLDSESSTTDLWLEVPDDRLPPTTHA